MRRGRRLAVLGVAGAVLLTLAWVKLWPGGDDALEPTPLRAFSLDSRPQSGRYLFDYAGNLEHYEEGVHRFLRRMSERFHIEAVIVTLPAMPAQTYPEALAVDLVNHWRIGGGFEGRGLLLLLVEQDKQVKLEVTYELEDVFTDAFTGYIEDLQLRPYYFADDIGTGLVAVMEELEQRAELKQQGEYTPGVIASLDAELLAGGAGARRSLDRYEKERESAAAAADGPGKGARSPQEAWSVMLTKWAGEGADIDMDVYTGMTRMAMGDPNHADARIGRSLPHWRNADYQVLQDGEYAVIWFGNVKGWDNAPFLFCRTPTGWKFDIVHQRQLVVMGENPDWMIEQGDYPYVGLLVDAPQSTGKDLPLPAEDRYFCRDDAGLARQIRELEKAHDDSPDDIGVLLSLARLGVITGQRPAHVQPLLKRLRELAPDNPEVYRYAAIYNVNAFFQYKTALKDMQAYIELRPDDAFGHNFIGFLYNHLGDYEASIESLERAVGLAPDNVYAYSLLARDYALLYRKAESDSSRRRHREQSLTMLQKAASSPTPDAVRVARLRAWLDRRLR
jgi:tetratricopeptide (TPR) repeat protein